MNKKALIPMTILATLAVAGVADAHNALATPSCSGLTYSATNYDKTVTNTIVVKVDGATVHQDLDFKASDAGSTPWSQTVNHTWSVVVNAPGTQYDRSYSGTWQACQVAPTTTAPTTTIPATTTTVAPTTTLPTTTEPATTTPVVEIITPPVPCPYNPTVPADSPLCVPPSTVSDVLVLTAEPVLPATGGSDTVLIGACILFGAGIILLVARGRRVR